MADINGNKIYLGLDVSSKTIGISLIVDDGSEYGKILELTHINPKAPTKKSVIEQLFIKKKMFGQYIEKFKDYGIDKVIIEEPLLSSNNSITVSTLLRFNGMVSECIYDVLGIVPEYISSYDARKYSFPELMSIRKYGKDESQYTYEKILKEIRSCKLVLFGSYPWTIDKKVVIQEKVSEKFPNIQWLYDKKGNMKKENFDSTDSYVAVLGYINKTKYGDINFSISNIKEGKTESNKRIIEYDVEYWDRSEHRTTYVD